jgi:hypothetical protein
MCLDILLHISQSGSQSCHPAVHLQVWSHINLSYCTGVLEAGTTAAAAKFCFATEKIPAGFEETVCCDWDACLAFSCCLVVVFGLAGERDLVGDVVGGLVGL